MSAMKFHLLALSLIISSMGTLFIGCQQSHEKIEPKLSAPSREYEIKEFKISETLKPIDMALNDNYICILHEAEASDEQIFVFDAENLNFLYKFAKRGQGPEETLALDFMKNFRGDSIDLIDQANYKKLTYVLMRDSAKLVETKHLDLPNFGPLQESYWVNDSIMIFNTLDGHLLTYNDNDGQIVGSVNISDLVKGIPAENSKKIGDFSFSIINTDVIVGLRFFNELFKLRLTDDFNFKLEEALAVNANNINTDKIFDNYGYYSFIHADDKYILAQYYGCKLKAMQPFPLNIGSRNLKYDLLLLDSNLVPIGMYQPDFGILRAYIDAERKRIYFWDAFDDFDKLKYIELEF